MASNSATRDGHVARPDREFARAHRHSRLVRRLKIGLPLLASAIVLGALAVTWFARSLPADVSVASTSIEDGRLVMQDPRMSGVDGNNRPFSMVADKAIQALGGSGIDLEGVKANLTVDDSTTAELLAAKGRYDPQIEKLRLFDRITVEMTNGVTISMNSAEMSLKEGSLEGTGPVDVATPNQRLEAGSVTVTQNGKRLSFGNRVRLTLLPNSPSADSSGAEPSSSEQTP